MNVIISFWTGIVKAYWVTFAKASLFYLDSLELSKHTKTNCIIGWNREKKGVNFGISIRFEITKIGSCLLTCPNVMETGKYLTQISVSLQKVSMPHWLEMIWYANFTVFCCSMQLIQIWTGPPLSLVYMMVMEVSIELYIILMFFHIFFLAHYKRLPIQVGFQIEVSVLFGCCWHHFKIKSHYYLVLKTSSVSWSFHTITHDMHIPTYVTSK